MSFMDPLYSKIGEIFYSSYDEKNNKAIGYAEVIIGTAFSKTGKFIHKKQGISGHLLNKIIGTDPISNAIEDFEYMAKEGKKRLNHEHSKHSK